MKVKNLSELEEESVSHNAEIKKKVLIRNGEIPKVTQLAQVVFMPGQIAPAHVHKDMYEVFYARSGKGVILINGKKIKFEAGTCITVEPGESHEVRNVGSQALEVNVLGVEI